jgi:hypothetical protein
MPLFRRRSIPKDSAPVEFDPAEVAELKRLFSIILNAGWSIWQLFQKSPTMMVHAKKFIAENAKHLISSGMPTIAGGGPHHLDTVFTNLAADPLGKELIDEIRNLLFGLGVIKVPPRGEE